MHTRSYSVAFHMTHRPSPFPYSDEETHHMFAKPAPKHAATPAQAVRRLERMMRDPRTDIAILQREQAYFEGRDDAVAKRLAREVARRVGNPKRTPKRFAY